MASVAYNKIVASNIRPKCEPVIRVKGKDNLGNEIDLVWKSKNIKDLTYKRSIDPVGRELPSIELTWTEIYTGKLNAENYPEKYNNIIKYMEVEFDIVQDLGFRNNWEALFKGEIKWGDLFSSETWKTVKNSVPKEVIKTPKLLLTAKPVVNGQTIMWHAKDFLGFLDNVVLKDCNPFTLEIPFFNPILQEIQENMSTVYSNNETIKEALRLTYQNIDDFQSRNNPILDKRIIANSTLKNVLLNYVSILNLKPYAIDIFYYLDFKEDGSCYIQTFANYNSQFLFGKKIMYETPKITNITNISSYEFKRYSADFDMNSNYQKSYSKVETYDKNGNPLIYRFDFDGYGAALLENNPNHNYLPYELTYALSDNPEDIIVTPIKLNAHNHKIITNFTGEIFTEDNPLNPYDDLDGQIIRRANFLNSYFNENSSVVEFSTLPVNHIPLGYGVDVETDLYSSNGKEVIKTGMIVSQELTYSGAFKQKNILHEYPIGIG